MRAVAMRVKTSFQWPILVWRKSRIVGYQRESSRPHHPAPIGSIRSGQPDGNSQAAAPGGPAMCRK